MHINSNSFANSSLKSTLYQSVCEVIFLGWNLCIPCWLSLLLFQLHMKLDSLLSSLRDPRWGAKEPSPLVIRLPLSGWVMWGYANGRLWGHGFVMSPLFFFFRKEDIKLFHANIVLLALLFVYFPKSFFSVYVSQCVSSNLSCFMVFGMSKMSSHFHLLNQVDTFFRRALLFPKQSLLPLPYSLFSLI